MAFRGPLWSGLCPLGPREQSTHQSTARGPLQRLCALCVGSDLRRDQEAAQARESALRRKKLLRRKIYQQLLLGKDGAEIGHGENENTLRQELSSELAALRSSSPEALKQGRGARATGTSRWGGQPPPAAPVRLTVRSMW